MDMPKMHVARRKVLVLTIITLVMLIFLSRIYSDCLKNNFHEDSAKKIVESFETDTEDDIINFTILGKKTLSISRDRIYLNHLDNRWELGEIDDILSSIKGFWTTDQYMGFITPEAVGVDVFDNDLSEDFRKEWLEYYNQRVEKAKSNVPDISFSVKEYIDIWDKHRSTNENYIYIDGAYRSPISIVLSLDRIYDNQPEYRDQVAVSFDFIAEYPVLYIKFFVKDNDENTQLVGYKPATLVITSDNRFYILIDGAFYSLKNQ